MQIVLPPKTREVALLSHWSTPALFQQVQAFRKTFNPSRPVFVDEAGANSDCHHPSSTAALLPTLYYLFLLSRSQLGTVSSVLPLASRDIYVTRHGRSNWRSWFWLR